MQTNFTIHFCTRVHGYDNSEITKNSDDSYIRLNLLINKIHDSNVVTAWMLHEISFVIL